MTRDEALALLQAGETKGDEASSWHCAFGPLVLLLPNFGWRRRAIAAHDLHHLMTGYPQTMRGEFQMAAWEFGAGRYPHWGATLACAPLILAGMLWSPSRIRRAFRSGRSSRSLYESLSSQSG